MKYLNEYKEYKKPKSTNPKVIDISKVEIRNLCIKLNLDSNNIKYIGSGAWGNAYKIGDKVLKITEHKDEAKSIYDLVKSNIKIPGVINYYSVNMFRYKKGYLYAIVMDYAQSLKDFLKNKYTTIGPIIQMIDSMFDIIWNNWDELKLKQYMYFIQLIREEYDIENKTVIYFMNKVWRLYYNLQQHLLKCPDLHSGNIGIKDNEFIFYDYATLKYVRKFSEPSLIY